MADSLPVFKGFKDNEFKEEYFKKYAKKLNMPDAITIFAKFHPLMPDHIITINKIKFPKIGKGDKVEAKIHEHMHKDLIGALESKYLNDAKQNLVKRGKKVSEMYELQKEESADESFPSEPLSDEWDDEEDSFEGGEETNHIDLNINSQEEEKTIQTPKAGKKKQAKKRAGKSCVSKFKRNKNVIQTVEMKYPKEFPKVKGEFKREKPIQGEFKEESDPIIRKDENEQYIFNKAVDLFIEDNNLYYSYRGLDEDLLDDDTVDRFEKFDESHDIKNLYSGHYVY